MPIGRGRPPSGRPRRELGGVEFTIDDKHRSTCVDECAGVGGLMIAGCARQGDEHAGKTSNSHFGDR